MTLWVRMGVMMVLVGVARMGYAEEAATQAGTQPNVRRLNFTVGKETTRIVEPLKADGSPDYVAALNALKGKGVTAENNGFVVFLEVVGTGKDVLKEGTKEEVLKMLGVKDVTVGKSVWKLKLEAEDFAEGGLEEIQREWKEAQLKIWEETEYPHLAGFLKERGDLLDKVIQAVEKDKWWEPLVRESLTEPRDVTWAYARDMALVLRFRAMLCAGRNDFEGFLRNVMAIKKLARHVASGRRGAWLNAVAIDRWASEAIGVVVGSGRLTAEECLRVEKGLAELKPLRAIADWVDTEERWAVLESAVRLSRGQEAMGLSYGIKGEGELGRLRRFSVNWDVVLRDVNRYYDVVTEGLKKEGFAERNAAIGEAEKELERQDQKMFRGGQQAMFGKQIGETDVGYTKRMSAVLLIYEWARYSHVDLIRRETQLRGDLVNVLLAAGRYRAEKGEWPEGLEVLVPGYLKEGMADPFGKGAAIKYAKQGNGVIVYSVGRDGQDDGGAEKVEDKINRGDVGVGWRE